MNITINEDTPSKRVVIETDLSVACIFITKFPTQNCQVSSIGCFNNLLTSGLNIHEAINECLKKQLLCRMVLIDVNQGWERKVDELFSTIVVKSPYISTNGSSMILYLIKL